MKKVMPTLRNARMNASMRLCVGGQCLDTYSPVCTCAPAYMSVWHPYVYALPLAQAVGGCGIISANSIIPSLSNFAVSC